MIDAVLERVTGDRGAAGSKSKGQVSDGIVACAFLFKKPSPVLVQRHYPTHGESAGRARDRTCLSYVAALSYRIMSMHEMRSREPRSFWLMTSVDRLFTHLRVGD